MVRTSPAPRQSVEAKLPKMVNVRSLHVEAVAQAAECVGPSSRAPRIRRVDVLRPHLGAGAHHNEAVVGSSLQPLPLPRQDRHRGGVERDSPGTMGFGVLLVDALGGVADRFRSMSPGDERSTQDQRRPRSSPLGIPWRWPHRRCWPARGRRAPVSRGAA